jgi:di/tricarboxylate transporter
MTTAQWLSIATLVGMMALFLWGRFRYDVTAGIALMAALLLGLVKPEEAFSGFADDIVVIVGSALVVSAAVQRSGVIEIALSFVSKHVRRVRSQLLLLTASVGIASGLVKNVGALAMLMPAALQMAKKNETSPSVYLMPMAFASLLGGLMTLVGTSPNIIVSRVREDMTGEPFGMFDYFPTGFGLFVVGLLFLRFGYRLLPRDRRAASTLGEALDVTGYVTEATVGEGSPAVGQTIAAFTKRHGQEVVVKTLLRNGKSKPSRPNVRLRAEDILILGGDPAALERVIATDRLILEGQSREAPEGSDGDEIGVIEAVVNSGSILIGQTAARMRLQERYGVNLIAISRAEERLTRQIGALPLRAGDLIVLQGPLSLLPERLGELGALPLAERALRLGASKRGWLPILILAFAMTATATGLVPVAVAFFAAAGLVVLTGALPVREAY